MSSNNFQQSYLSGMLTLSCFVREKERFGTFLILKSVTYIWRSIFYQITSVFNKLRKKNRMKPKFTYRMSTCKTRCIFRNLQKYRHHWGTHWWVVHCQNILWDIFFLIYRLFGMKRNIRQIRVFQERARLERQWARQSIQRSRASRNSRQLRWNQVREGSP